MQTQVVTTKDQQIIQPLVGLFPRDQDYFKLACEYRIAVTLHQVGVKSLAFKLLEGHPQAFPNIADKYELVESFLDLHDQAKLDPKYFWDLLRYYGVNINQLIGEQKQKARSLIQSVNLKDSINAQMFFVVHGLVDDYGNLNKIAEELKKLERISDLVDRGSSAVASREFGRSLAKASEFLSEPDEVELALWLESQN